MSVRERLEFTLQWHLTAKCEYECKHCYMRDYSTYESEVKNELDFSSCLKIIDDFKESLNHWEIPGRINFTGGDPLLKNLFFDIIAYTRKKDISVGILGNADKLDYKIAEKLKKLGVFRYQLSIDGMEKTHDQLRGKKGAFKETLKAIHILEDVGIPSVLMFTVSKVNAHELIDVMKLAVKEGVSIFSFSRLVPIGSGENLKEEMIPPQEYRALLLNVLEEFKILEEQGSKTIFGRKESLWALLYKELGLLKPLPKDKNIIYSGCTIGCSGLVILADGTVLACRRLPVKIGKVPEQKILDIFVNSKELNRMRDINSMKKCYRCDLRQFCRGCPAIAYSITGDYLAADPQCWYDI